MAIVLDGSGSMWGKLAGSDEPKFRLAAEAVMAGLAGVPKATRLGVVLFGQRSRGGCTVANTLRPPEPVEEGSVRAALDRLNPQGRGPLTLGLQRALEALEGSSKPRRVIIVHDDPDNCTQNVCDLALTAKERFPDLVVHTVSLATKPQNQGAMQCLADITGGRIVEVADSGGLSRAMAEVLRLAALSSRPAPAKRPSNNQSSAAPDGAARPLLARPPSPEPARAPTPGLMLSAVLKKDDRRVIDNVVWTINGQDGDGWKTLKATSKAQPSIALPPGRYLVELRTSGLSSTKEIDVAKGPRTRSRFVLDAAAISLSAALGENGSPINDAFFEIVNGSGGAPVWSGLAQQEPVVLAAGSYTIKANVDALKQSRKLSVEAGQEIVVVVPMNAGQLALKAKDVDGRKPDRATITIETDDSSSPTGRRVVRRSGHSEATFTLPPGTYYVEIRIGSAVHQEQVAVASGKRVEQTIAVPMMRLTIVSKLRGRKALLQDGVRYRVWRLNTPKAPPIVSSAAEPVLLLSPGPYRIESRVGQQNAVIVRDFEVTRARSGRLTLEHEAGSLALGIAPEARAGGAGDVYWEISDPKGAPIWRSLGGTPTVTLKTGEYSIVAEVAGKTLQQKLRIESGRHLNVELGLN